MIQLQAAVPFAALRDPEAIANWPHTQGRDGARTPMPWQHDAPQGGFSSAEPWFMFSPEHCALAVELQEADKGSTLHLCRHLLALRRAYPALRGGALDLIEAGTQLFGFERRAGNQRLRCLFNPTKAELETPLLAGWRPVLGIGADAGALALGAFSAIIAEPS